MLSINGVITGQSGTRNGVKDSLIQIIQKDVLPLLKTKTCSLNGFNPIATTSRLVKYRGISILRGRSSSNIRLRFVWFVRIRLHNDRLISRVPVHMTVETFKSIRQSVSGQLTNTRPGMMQILIADEKLPISADTSRDISCPFTLSMTLNLFKI